MGSRNTLIVIVVTVVLLGLGYWLLGGGKKLKHVWAENYKVDSNEPFGTAFIFKMLEHQHPSATVIKKHIAEVLDDTVNYKTGNNYVFIGADIYMNDADLVSLLQFVGRGNNAFIATRSIPKNIMEYIYAGECDEWTGFHSRNDTTATLNFFKESLQHKDGYKYSYRNADLPDSYEWNIINGTYFCDSATSFASIGYIDSFYVNYMVVPYQGGNIYIHSNPIAFSNYFMRDSNALAYADIVFSHIGDGPILWDEYSKIYKYKNNDSSENQTPLSYILSQKSLRYSWYLLIIGAILYLVFMARRRQRVMDVIEPNTNTSLAYISTISTLYLNHANHIAIAHHKMKYFNSFTRHKYGIVLHGDEDGQLLKLAHKSKIPVNDIRSILKLYSRISKLTEINEDTLISFHRALEYFYNNCK